MMRYSDLLFKSNKEPIATCPGLTVGMTIPLATAVLSSKRPVTATRIGPKISRAARGMDEILTGGLNGYCSEDGREVYIESPSGEAIYICDEVFCVRRSSSFSQSLIVAALLLATVNASEWSEVQTVIENAITEFSANTEISQTTMGLLCDSYYYNTKDFYRGEYDFTLIDKNLQIQIQQAIRTGHLIPFPEGIREKVGTDTKLVEYKAPTAGKTPIPAGNILTACKDGEYLIPYEWEPEEKLNIVPAEFLDTYVSNTAFRSSVQLIRSELLQVCDRLTAGLTGKDAIKKNYANMIFVGKPGTGKTTTAEALSASLGLPIYTVRCSKNIEEDEFEGKTKVSKGEFVLKDTQFLNGFTKGGIIVLEEFNLADPAIMQGALGQAIEAPFMLMKDGVDVVYRHPMTVIIGTMNVATQGSREPNEAFTSRLPFTFPIEDPTDRDFIEILVNASGDSKEDCTKVYKTYKKVLKYIKEVSSNEEMAMTITLRHCLAALKLMKFHSFEQAIYNTMIGALLIRDIDFANDVYQNCVLATA